MRLSENTKADSDSPCKMIKLLSSIYFATFGIEPGVALHKLRALCFQCLISVYLFGLTRSVIVKNK